MATPVLPLALLRPVHTEQVAAALRSALEEQDRRAVLKPVNVTVQYLSTGRTRESHARGRDGAEPRRRLTLSQAETASGASGQIGLSRRA